MSTPTRCVVCGTVEYWYHGVRELFAPTTKPERAFPTTCNLCLNAEIELYELEDGFSE